MKEVIKHVVGVDIAKDKFDVVLMSVSSTIDSKVIASKKFLNTTIGFKDFLKWLSKHNKSNAPIEILMEATGVYHEKLAIWLTENKQKVYVVLPNKSRMYMKALGIKTKNDGVDAKGLALMCVSHRFKEWKSISKYNYELRLLTRYYQSTQELRTSFLNQLHALEHSGYSSNDVKKQLKKSIDLFEKQLTNLQKSIEDHIKSNPETQRKVANICEIKGVGILTIATIIAETNGFELFDNQSQLVSYAGYDIVENQSGNRVGKTKISKKGNARIRRILHMASLSAVRFNEKPFRTLFDRVNNKNSIKMKGYVAVQKKLLIVIFSLWKNDKKYDSNYENKSTSGNDGATNLFPFFCKEKEVVPQLSSTTLDEHRYNEVTNALFP